VSKKSIVNHPVNQYAEQVLSGNITAGKLVQLTCKRHFNDLSNGHKRGLKFNYEYADHVIDFYKYLRHSKGKWAGSIITLEPWQQFIKGCAFGWTKNDGLRRFRIIYQEVARKNGKSTDVAGLCNYMLIADGEPGAEVYTAATKEDQAKITYNEAKKMIRKSPELSKRVKILQRRIDYPPTESELKFLGADSETQDGLNVHFAAIDEFHAHKTAGMWDVLDTATGSREQPMLYIITTAGTNRFGICFDVREYCVQILKGIIEDDSYFPYIATLDMKSDGLVDIDDDWINEDNWIKSNPNLGVSVYQADMRLKAKKAKNNPSSLNNFLCKHMNIWVSQAERWLPLQAWDDCKNNNMPDKKTLDIYIGLDLSSTTDLTAVVGVGVKNNEYFVYPRIYIPEDILMNKEEKDQVLYSSWVQQGFLIVTPGNCIDKDFIETDIIDFFKDCNIKEVAYDSWQADQMVQHLMNQGLTCVPVSMGYSGMNNPSKQLMELTLKKQLHHDGNQCLRWMADNLVMKSDAEGRIRPIKDKGRQKIDGMVALILGLSRAVIEPEATGSIYDTKEADIF
jgi:phage terminase large subunit-like protein